MENNLRIEIVKDPVSRNTNIYIISKYGPKDVLIIPNRTRSYQEEEMNYDGVQQEPSFRLSNDVVEVLFQKLSEQGFKPKESSFIEGKLQATESHLEDMRKLVFKTE